MKIIKTLLFLTQKARNLKQDYDSVSEQMGEIYYDGFTKKEIIEFESYLERIMNNLEKWSEQ